MTGQKRLIFLTLSFEGFQLGSHIHLAVAVVADVKRYHANGVAGDEELIFLFVVKHEGEDSVQVFEELDAFLTIESENDLAIAPCQKVVLSSKPTSDFLMVVYLAIHRQYLLAVGRIQRLSARLWIYDAQALMGEDGSAAAINATPVGAAMAYLLTHAQCFLTQHSRLFLHVQYGNDSTHDVILL